MTFYGQGIDYITLKDSNVKLLLELLHAEVVYVINFSLWSRY